MSRKIPAEEGVEKRGVVKYGWTPPADSRVKLGRSDLPASKKAKAGEDEDDLDDDLTKRLADRAAE